MNSALSGLIVADLSRVLAGPYSSMLLADLGATVVKVERPRTGDDTRSWYPPTDAQGQSTYFQSVNRNKMSIALDLENPADRRVAHELAACADVLIQNHKPGALRRFGLDYDNVRAGNPRVIYCSISGFGTGPGKDLPGYDLLVQAMGGLMSITGSDEPTKAGVAVVDILTGLHATVGILAALHHRDLTGEGQQLDISLLGALLSSLTNQTSAYVAGGVVPERMGNAHPSISPYEVYPTADRPLILAVGNDGQFAQLCSVLGAPELAQDRQFSTNPARVENRPALNAELGRLLSSRGADEWQRLLTNAGVPCGPINDIGQAVRLAEDLGLAPVAVIDDSRRPDIVRQVANPVHFSGTPVAYRSAPPHVDEDREAVLAMLRERR